MRPAYSNRARRATVVPKSRLKLAMKGMILLIA